MTEFAFVHQPGDLGPDVNGSMTAETPAAAIAPGDVVVVPSLGTIQSTVFYGGGFTAFRLELSSPSYTPYAIDAFIVPLHPITLDRFQDAVNGDPFIQAIFSFTGAPPTYHDFGNDTGVSGFIGNLSPVAFKILLNETGGLGNLTVTINVAALAPLNRGFGLE